MKSRWFSIIMYILTFGLIFFITSVVVINAYYFIPFESNGLSLSRSFTLIYDIVFAIIALIFSFIASYCFLSIFGKKSLKEVFAPRRRKTVFISTFLAFFIVYYLVELLVGYIVLNIDDPTAFINGNNESSVIITSDKSVDNVHINNNYNNSSMFLVDGEHILSISDSNLIHNGSNMADKVGINTVVSAINNATFNGDRIMVTFNGLNSQAFFFKNSTLHLFNSNISMKGKASNSIYSDASKIYVNSTSITNEEENSIVLKNGTEASFERTNLIINDNCSNIFNITSDDSDSINSITLSNSSIDKGNYNLFNVENTKAIINLYDVKVDWSEVEKFMTLINNSDVTINIKNSMVSGNIKFDDNSNLKINIEKSQFSSIVIGNKGFELSMDDNSVFTSPGSIHLSKFEGSELAFRKVISIQNDVKLDTNN